MSPISGAITGSTINPDSVAMLVWLPLMFTGLLGTVAGSAIACWCGRYLSGGSILRPARSCCDACGSVLIWRDTLPLLSYWLLKGRCRRCRSPIPFGLFLAECAGALICLLLCWRFGYNPKSLLLCLFFLSLLALCIIDADSLLLPDALLAVAAVPLLILLARGEISGWPQSLWAALTGGGLLLALRQGYLLLRGREGLGLGDVKLVFLLGLLTDVAGVFDLIFTAAVFGLAAACLLRLKQGEFPAVLPFGPFLSLASFWLLLWGKHALMPW